MTMLNKVVPPNLALAPEAYERSYHDQLNSILRLYFNQLNGNVNELIGSAGGRFLSMPCAAVQRSTDLVFAANDTATQITFDTEDYLNGMALNAGDGIQAEYSGWYNYQFSIQFSNTDSQIHAAYVWLRKNGVDLTGTGSKFDVPNKHGSSDGYLIAACNFYVQLDPGDTVEMWAAVSQRESAGTDGIYIEAYPAQTSPFAMPSIPSVVATVTFVSES